MPPELMRFLESMRTRGRAGESRQRQGILEEQTAIQEWLSQIGRKETKTGLSIAKRKSKGSIGSLLGGAVGLMLLSALGPAGLAGASALGIGTAAGAGSLFGGLIGGVRGGFKGLLPGESKIGKLTDVGAPGTRFKRSAADIIRGKEKIGDVDIQNEIWNQHFGKTILTNALSTSVAAGLGADKLQGIEKDLPAWLSTYFGPR